MLSRVINNIGAVLISALTSLCIAYALFGVGYCACTAPQATQSIGNTFSGWENSVFEKEDMAAVAEAARSFSIEGTSIDQLNDVLYPIIVKNYPGFEGSLKLKGIDTQLDSSKVIDQLNKRGLSSSFEEYLLPENAISHLQDCTTWFQTGRISTGVVCAFGLAGLILLFFMRGRKWAGRTTQVGAGIVLLLLLLLAAWAVFDFNGLFRAMHAVLFSQGNWTFSADSLLIQLFPEAFWAAMAALWVLVSVACSVVVLLIGKLLAR